MSVKFDPERPPTRSRLIKWFGSDDGESPFFSPEAIDADNAAADAYENLLIRWGWRSARRRERIYRKNPPTPVVVASPLRSWVDNPKHWIRSDNANG